LIITKDEVDYGVKVLDDALCIADEQVDTQ